MCDRPKVSAEVVKHMCELLDRGATIITEREASGEYRVAVRGLVSDGVPRLGLGCGDSFEAAWKDCFQFFDED